MLYYTALAQLFPCSQLDIHQRLDLQEHMMYLQNQKVSEILVQLGRQNESQNHEKSALKANMF